MEILLTNVNVLREVALRCGNAHIAFLAHAPYRALFDNVGSAYIQYMTHPHHKGGTWSSYTLHCCEEHEGRQRVKENTWPLPPWFVPEEIELSPDRQRITYFYIVRNSYRETFSKRVFCLDANETLFPHALAIHTYIYENEKLPPFKMLLPIIDFIRSKE